jgi:cell division protein FtsB
MGVSEGTWMGGDGKMMEWFLIFFMFYVFLSVWVISSMLDKILKLLSEIVKEMEKGRIR